MHSVSIHREPDPEVRGESSGQHHLLEKAEIEVEAAKGFAKWGTEKGTLTAGETGTWVGRT